MKFNRYADFRGRRYALESWATRQRPWCVFRIRPELWVTTGLSVSLEVCVCGVGASLATYPWSKKSGTV